MKNGELTSVDTKTNKTESGGAGVENRGLSLISPNFPAATGIKVYWVRHDLMDTGEKEKQEGAIE